MQSGAAIWRIIQGYYVHPGISNGSCCAGMKISRDGSSRVHSGSLALVSTSLRSKILVLGALPALLVPAHLTSKKWPYIACRYPSAIWKRAELWSQMNSTRGFRCVPSPPCYHPLWDFSLMFPFCPFSSPCISLSSGSPPVRPFPCTGHSLLSCRHGQRTVRDTGPP